MTTRNLIDAIESGNSVDIQSAFEDAMSSRIVERLDAMRQEVSKNMFAASTQSEQVEVSQEGELEEAASSADKVHSDAIHVQHVGGGKYKVHAVGKNFSHGIKAGDHLNDTELDDFQEMGGKIKHVK